MTSIQGCLDVLLAGFKNGFAGCPDFPYSMMFANLALLTPSLRGSLNPTLTLWFPLRSTKAGDTPNADTNSLVDLLGSFVSFPITELKLDFIFSNTISLSASRTLGTISSVLLPNLEIFIKSSSGIFILTLAIFCHHLFCYNLDIHISIFHIINAYFFISPIVTYNKHFRFNG